MNSVLKPAKPLTSNSHYIDKNVWTKQSEITGKNVIYWTSVFASNCYKSCKINNQLISKHPNNPLF